MGITNLLEANMQAGLVHCLRLSYHDDARIRVIFLNIFTKIVNAGTDFKMGSGTSKGSLFNSQLCEASNCRDELLYLTRLMVIAIQMLKAPDVRVLSVLVKMFTNVVLLVTTCACDS
jgi:hypothetical protein